MLPTVKAELREDVQQTSSSSVFFCVHVICGWVCNRGWIDGWMLLSLNSITAIEAESLSLSAFGQRQDCYFPLKQSGRVCVCVYV